MKKVLLGLLLLSAVTTTTIVSCKKTDKESPAATVVRPEKSVLLGEYTPYRIDPKGDDMLIGFVQSARLFTLVSGEKNQAYLDLLKTAFRNDEPVKVMVYEGTNEISEVVVSSAAGRQAYTEAKVTTEVSTKETLPIIPNETALNNLFNTCRFDASIPFAYATDGCYARAHKMRQHILAAGYDCAKFFVYGYLAASTNTCCVIWGYHVAPLVRFRDAAGAVQLRVLDPSLFTTPVDQNTWVNKCRNTSCDWQAAVSGTSIQPGNVYVRTSGGSLIYDDNYAKTNCTLNAYAGLSGCANTGNNSACW